MKIILFLTYTTIIVVWIWARYNYFRVDSKRSRMSSYLYDPIAAIHIAFTYFCFSISTSLNTTSAFLALAFYIFGLFIFVRSISMADHFSFAFGDEIDQLITQGTYSYVRHPLYLSYTLVWLGSALLFNSIILWITLIYLMSFYFFSAKKEEEAILKSKYSREYAEYCKNVGMFLPRIRGWKS